MEDTQDVNTEEVVEPQEESSETPQEQQPEKGTQEYNWKAAREAQKRREEEYEARIRQLEEKLQPQEPEAPSSEFDDDDFVEGRHLKSSLKKLEEKLQATESQLMQDRLANQYKDFYSVVSEENLRKLKESEPEVFKVIISGGDPYARGVSAYKTLKRYGIVDDPQVRTDKGKAEENLKKPLSSQAVKSSSPLADASTFNQYRVSEEQKKELYKQMNYYASGGS